MDNAPAMNSVIYLYKMTVILLKKGYLKFQFILNVQRPYAMLNDIAFTKLELYQQQKRRLFKNQINLFALKKNNTQTLLSYDKQPTK